MADGTRSSASSAFPPLWSRMCARKSRAAGNATPRVRCLVPVLACRVSLAKDTAPDQGFSSLPFVHTPLPPFLCGPLDFFFLLRGASAHALACLPAFSLPFPFFFKSAPHRGALFCWAVPSSLFFGYIIFFIFFLLLKVGPQ
ncbi:hypothetical protein TW95_gp1393 [Pandoravirus inopinatum]|uniref:Transmembrane protein n=1 Tax=Pandoravirus inopinatum TaxID=1605721 RepID=A0A0B5JEC6_9VIRU|nr:hypothetical protein TW95_gp1393 [Pandoravirus inopinatum]AJF98127.1 hypothetical protein [Pandoravirus inopinatum]